MVEGTDDSAAELCCVAQEAAKRFVPAATFRGDKPAESICNTTPYSLSVILTLLLELHFVEFNVLRGGGGG